MFDIIEKYLTQSILKDLEERKVICWNNNKPENLRIKKGQYTSFQVPGFITKINYPPNTDRDYSITVYVHYIEYQARKYIEAHKLKINSFEDYLAVYNKILEQEGIKSEAERFYDNFLRREDFKNARYAGKFRKG